MLHVQSEFYIDRPEALELQVISYL